MTKRFVGVDGEMTGVNRFAVIPEQPVRLCQIGVATGAADVFTSDIGWQAGTYSTEEKALEVNGFDIARIEAGLPAEEVDQVLFDWMTARGIGPKEAIAVGWNVGSFDFAQFIIPTLPKFSSLFAHRYVDLNSICFALTEAKDLLPPTMLKGPEWKFEKWKDRAKEVSAHMLGTENWHDAGYDAAASLLQFQWLSQQIGGALFQ